MPTLLARTQKLARAAREARSQAQSTKVPTMGYDAAEFHGKAMVQLMHRYTGADRRARNDGWVGPDLIVA